MKRSSSVPGRRGGAFVCCLVAAVLLAPGLARGGIVGSAHDWTETGLRSTKTSLPKNGACSACHVAHKSNGSSFLWVRQLAEENTFYDQVAAPNYVAGSTRLCYDCHETDGVSGADDDPLGGVGGAWVGGYEPQDIALGGANVGYYELSGGIKPGPGNPAPAPPGSPPVTTSTGGHFFKAKLGQAPNGGYGLGDKLACAICHDPHDQATGTNEAMLRTNITVGGTITIGNDLRASSKTRSHTTGTGRQMCAGCHQYSDTGLAEKVLFNVLIPKPPAMTYVGHLSTETAAECTACHAHNAPDCGSCHSSPPPGQASGYAGIDEPAGPHPRHARTVAGGGYGFSCAQCHSGFPTGHQNAGYQDVSFLATKNPTGAWVAGTRACNDLYCHSRGARINDTVNNLGVNTRAWTSTPDWSLTTLGCEACHGSNPARAEGLMNYGAPGYTNGTVIGGAAKANSHAKHAAYPCARCHYNVVRDTDPAGGWTLYDVSLHASNTTASFTFNVDPDPSFPAANFDSYLYNAAGGTCDAIDCHNGNSAQWGATLLCTDCHMRANAAGGDRDDWDGANGTPALIDSDQWNVNAFPATGHGRSSGWYPWPDNNASGAPANLACLTTDATGDTPLGGCHTAKASHGQANNPFRLATPNNTTFAFEKPSGTINGDSLNLFCQTCHASALEQTHSKAITGDWNAVSWGLPAGTPTAFKCTDCHDPHGDSPDYMIHAQVFAASSNDYGVPVQTGLGIQPASGTIVFDVTTPNQTQADYVDTAAASSTKICQVCHQSNSYFTRSAPPVAHNAGVECMQCHVHKEGFKPSACESCHNGVQTVYPLAPNVMGNGTSATGTGGATPKPYDDGSFGYNVNGHGRDDTPSVPGNSINVACTACHLGQLAGTHLDGNLDGHTPSSGNANPFHLVSGFIGSPTTDWNAAVTFDNYCYSACHDGRISDMRHALDSDPAAGAMQFGQKGSLGAPNNTPPPEMFYDAHITWLSSYDGGTNYGVCVSCHNPHGSGASSPRADGNNKMVHYRWSIPADLCTKCH